MRLRTPAALAMTLAIAAATPALAQVPVPSALTTEWRFTGDTNEFIDKVGGPGTLEYADGDNGTTDQIDIFTTTSADGIPGLQNTDTQVLRFARHEPNTVGYQIRPLTGSDPMQFTMIWDIYLDANNVDAYQGLWNGSGTNANDAELHLEIQVGGFWHDFSNTGVGAQSIGAGTWALGEWNRFVYVNDYSGNAVQMYVNGTLAFTDVAVDYIYEGTNNASWVLSDQNGDVTEGWIAAFAFSDVLLDAATVAALGDPKPGGIFDYGSIGTNFECPSTVQNSSGGPASILADGSVVAADNDVTLSTTGMPANQFGYYLNSQVQSLSGFTPPGSQGSLCIGPAGIGRYNASVFNTGANGEGSLVLDLANTPTPSGSTSIQAGETWYFTTWFRDSNPGPTSNFSDAVCVAFQ